ncbi:MAG: dihydrofolate reductase [Cytophagales bacterium]|nr:MAG: dihydrofolate reductase [Cytophagales bacterium]
MNISLIAAVAQNGTIGRNDATGKPDLPWHLPDDFKFFKETTSGHPIIMGRKSLDALGKPLPKRKNIVITRNRDFDVPGVTIVHTLEDALTMARAVEENEIFVIGGAEIYALALPVATRLYLTEIQKEYDGDAHFPAFNKNDWRETSRRHHPADDRHEAAFDFVIYERNDPSPTPPLN